MAIEVNHRVSRTRAVAIKTLHLTLEILKERGGEARGRDVTDEISKRVSFDEWENSIYPSTGNTKWRSVYHFYSIGLIKSGFMVKKKGIWYLTPEGDKALQYSPEELVRVGDEGYRRWREANPKVDVDETTEDVLESPSKESAEFTVDEMEDRAYRGIEDYINSRNPYEFQSLCAALLRAMGYYTPFVAPKGRDGGIDIMAYRDPLGTVSPRIKVQVKHRESSATGPEVNQLQGILRRDDVGIFISSGGFTSDARVTARNANSHIELIDMERFIALWQEFYPKLPDEDKTMLPLTPIYFLAPGE